MYGQDHAGVSVVSGSGSATTSGSSASGSTGSTGSGVGTSDTVVSSLVGPRISHCGRGTLQTVTRYQPGYPLCGTSVLLADRGHLGHSLGVLEVLGDREMVGSSEAQVGPSVGAA